MSQHRVYQALGNAHQIFGCDRELFMCNTLALITLSIFTYNFITLIATVFMCSFVYFALYQMGKYDRRARHVWIRSLRYKPYYLAHCQYANRSYKDTR